MLYLWSLLDAVAGFPRLLLRKFYLIIAKKKAYPNTLPGHLQCLHELQNFPTNAPKQYNNIEIWILKQFGSHVITMIKFKVMTIENFE